MVLVSLGSAGFCWLVIEGVGMDFGFCISRVLGLSGLGKAFHAVFGAVFTDKNR